MVGVRHGGETKLLEMAKSGGEISLATKAVAERRLTAGVSLPIHCDLSFDTYSGEVHEDAGLAS